MPLYNPRHALQTPARGFGIGAKGGAALCVVHIAGVDKTQALGHGDVQGAAPRFGWLAGAVLHFCSPGERP